MLAPVFSLAGDSYLHNPGLPDAAGQLRVRIGTHFQQWTTQAEIAAFPADGAGDDDSAWTTAARLRRLQRILSGQMPAGAFLIGRSSGALVATRCAIACPVTAVICLAYPFRAPGRPDDPARVAHLELLRVPTLIVQGRADPYGGEDAARAYRLSPCITWHSVDGDHGLAGGPRYWDGIAQAVLAFCRAAAADGGAAGAGQSRESKAT